MRIAYVCTDPGVPVFGTKGASIHVQEVVHALCEAGHDVTLFARRIDGPTPARMPGVRVVALSPCAGSTSQQREQLLIAANRPTREAVELTGPFDAIYERHALWSDAPMELARAWGIPGVLEVNAPLIQEQAAFRSLHDVRGATAAARRSFADATAVLAVSHGVADYVRALEPLSGCIEVVPNGVDPDRFHPEVPASAPGVQGSCTIGFVGTLKPWHGVDLLVDAFALLPQGAVPTRLLIVGDGPQGPMLRERSRALGIADRVVFTGAVDSDRMPGLINSMDIAIAPYPQSQDCYFSPLKVFEYMACGRAIVASRIGQVCDVLTDGVDGILCLPGDAPALRRAIAQLISAPHTRASMGRHARDAAVASHSWAMVAQRITAMIERAASTQGAA